MSFDSATPPPAAGSTPRVGVLLVNLGTPDAPTPKAVRRYLAEFLWDPRIVERPRWLWWPVLHGIILRLRPGRVARAYRKIWTDAGSPLLTISQQQQTRLAERLAPVPVALAMRYGTPSIADGLGILQRAGIDRLVVVPLYPQYSATTTGSTFDAVSQELQRWRHVPELHFLNSYCRQEDYIAALAASVRDAWSVHGRPDKLLFSFHGLPQRYVTAGDPYPAQCQATAGDIANALHLAPDQWQLAYQSRFGPEAWLQPYLDRTLAQLAREGTTHVQVVCPGFAADCLETLEEINMQNREAFLQAGGKTFHYIPALNTRDDHIAMLARLVEPYLAEDKGS
ncbi:MAG TPA: ferrochelatase [Chromatiales bacterium]|nr:ferrochelatase [Chromatiales bacterium]